MASRIPTSTDLLFGKYNVAVISSGVGRHVVGCGVEVALPVAVRRMCRIGLGELSRSWPEWPGASSGPGVPVIARLEWPWDER